MDCELIEKDLVGFHFSTLDENARAAVEAHLPACGRCVRSFVALKRATELDAAPPDLARARLRRAVAQKLPPRRRLRTLGAVAAACLALALGALTLHAHRAPSQPAAARSLDDSARLSPASLQVL